MYTYTSLFTLFRLDKEEVIKIKDYAAMAAADKVFALNTPAAAIP